MDSQWSTLAGKRILVVDDSREITRLLADVLESHGADVTTVNSGGDAMVCLHFGRFDLVILDLVMPEIGGWQVLDFLRRVRPELSTRTIILTAYCYDRQSVRRMESVSLPKLFKPFNLDTLCSTACRVLASANHPAAA